MSTTEENTKSPVRVGDRFRTPTGEWKVIETKPGGRVELFNKATSCFQSRYAREVRIWERAS